MYAPSSRDPVSWARAAGPPAPLTSFHAFSRPKGCSAPPTKGASVQPRTPRPRPLRRLALASVLASLGLAGLFAGPARSAGWRSGARAIPTDSAPCIPTALAGSPRPRPRFYQTGGALSVGEDVGLFPDPNECRSGGLLELRSAAVLGVGQDPRHAARPGHRRARRYPRGARDHPELPQGRGRRLALVHDHADAVRRSRLEPGRTTTGTSWSCVARVEAYLRP